ncbi:MAG TPA: hypothetical protein VEU62_12980 [Bryobacterales bacterium]|nr:hypothetical protein [Bryobacterales bacterium]
MPTGACFRQAAIAAWSELRVWPTTAEEAQSGLARLLETVQDEDWFESLIIVDANQIRVRKQAKS